MKFHRRLESQIWICLHIPKVCRIQDLKIAPFHTHTQNPLVLLLLNKGSCGTISFILLRLNLLKNIGCEIILFQSYNYLESSPELKVKHSMQEIYNITIVVNSIFFHYLEHHVIEEIELESGTSKPLCPPNSPPHTPWNLHRDLLKIILDQLHGEIWINPTTQEELG
jgi:hypothetical protein